ncbi:RNA polymerase sigma-70 factor [Cytophagales bacterium LB-30]|uniref:RNA polymerase sigma-70 factor n=1 Tax=Shiella aurantiaca TaxID=3058365 RepID=A0ABT8F776_9BACT|nr:RNA polymerase sigma-70 factor [Shiella aurantiaca]MDN4166094.1 RNA polymerase sigma-70 factor [Shiella aurantiaca]
MGDTVYFQRLFDANYLKLCHVANRIVKDKDDARDIVQQAFLNFWERSNHWHTIQSHEAYLYSSVYHSSIAYFKKSKVHVSSQDHTFSAHTLDTPLEELSFMELEKNIIKAISKLPPKCREIFLLSREEELSYKLIAERLNISTKTVEAQMGIALKRLREDLSAQIPDKIFFLLFF